VRNRDRANVKIWNRKGKKW